MAPVVTHQSLAQGQIGCFLQFRGDGGVDLESASIGIVTVGLQHVVAHHLGQVGGFHLHVSGMETRRDRGLQRLVGLLLRDVAKILHAPDDVVAPLQCTFRVGDGVVTGRGLGQAGDHGDLRQVQLIQ